MFDTERHAVTVKHKDKEVTYYVRELGYYEFQEINQEAALAYPDPEDKERRGLKFMHETCAAAIENKDGTLAFTVQTWKRLPKEPATVLTEAVMKAQGLDLGKSDEEEETPKADPEGNG